MSDISVLGDYRTRPEALVDPPRRDVVMEESVARLRGLRKFSAETSLNKHKHPPLSGQRHGTIVDGKFIEDNSSHAKTFFRRRTKIKEEDRQAAEISISHDGEYAIAVCMALNEEASEARGEPAIIDDGTGPPLHEPEWADEGFLDPVEGQEKGDHQHDED